MKIASATLRCGMTLPELLIVVAIIGLLAVTVLPALSTTTEARRTREAARIVGGYCARAQGSAIGKSQWSGLLLQTTSNASMVVSQLRLASVPRPYSGAIPNARLAVQLGPDPINASTCAVLPESACPTINASPSASPQEISDLGSSSVNVHPQDLIRFGGEGSTYEIVVSSSTAIVVRMRDGGGGPSAGFSTGNHPWPALTPAAHTFEIFRQPVATGLPFEIPNNRVIDMGWSGYGPSDDVTAASYQRFNVPGQTVSILFDATGRVRLMMKGTGRVVPLHPVYLLVGRADRVGNTFASTLSTQDDSIGVNWQYTDSWWIAIEPLTGVVRSAECKQDAATVTESQLFIRNKL